MWEKCVTPNPDGSEPTPAPTKPKQCKHKVRVRRGKVDKSGFCTKKCPCDAYLGDCDKDADCKGDLVCAKTRGAAYGLDEDFDVCMPKEEALKPEEDDDEAEEDEDLDEGEQDVEAEKNLPSLEDVVKNPNLILDLPEETLDLLGDDLEKVKRDPSSILPTTNPDIFNKRKPPAETILDVKPSSLCVRDKVLGEKGYCVASKACKCGEGEGWCRSDEECKAGLICEEGRGKDYGMGASVAVCVRDKSSPSAWERSGKFEGDIDIESSRFGINQILDRYGLDTAEKVASAFPKSSFDGAAIKPDTKRPGHLRQLSEKRKLGATEQNILWPDGIIYFAYHSGVSDARKNVIQDAMDHWTENTCIQFVERTTQADYVEFQQPSSGCSSAVGKQGGKQVIRLSQACSVGNAIHEIMHALGFWHEQSRPDRNSWVTIDFDNVQAGKEHNFAKAAGSEIDSMGSNYDYGSIMHYGAWAFSSNGQRTINTRVENAVIGQRNGLSDHDIWQVRKLYGCAETTCPAGTYSRVRWYGTAPFCRGTCPANSVEVQESRFHGAFCFAGTKKKCKSCCRLTARTEMRWFGTAPICDGDCPVGWTQVRTSRRGRRRAMPCRPQSAMQAYHLR